MGDGDNQSRTIHDRVLPQAISRTLFAGQKGKLRPDNEDVIQEYESSLGPGWIIINDAYQKGWRIETVHQKKGGASTSVLHAHNRTGLCDMFAYVAIEERRTFQIHSPCGSITQTVGPFALPKRN